ncbi:MAG: hypothetical protein MUC88_00040 [Planctomycetes bacterium]|jgi:hypothetical protein|nr:hypothetical protein [Planctomycetota bacterium]
MNLYAAGEIARLSLQLEDGLSNRYPRASAYRLGSLESEVDLAHVIDGLYEGSWIPAASDIYSVTYRVFLDAARTVEDPAYGIGMESWRSINGLTGPIADAVLREVVADHSGVPGSLAAVVATLEARLTAARAASLDLIPSISDQATLARKIMQNRLELTEGAASNWVLYDDDSVTPLLTWDVQDKDGQGIRIAGFTPARRRPA